MSWQHHLNFLPLPHGQDAYGSVDMSRSLSAVGIGPSAKLRIDGGPENCPAAFDSGKIRLKFGVSELAGPHSPSAPRWPLPRRDSPTGWPHAAPSPPPVSTKEATAMVTAELGAC